MNELREIWILGATGRIGRALAHSLAADSSVLPVLVGRNERSLRLVADDLVGEVRTLAVPTDELPARIRENRPAVVVNVMGGYSNHAVDIARATMPGGLYVDLANDLTSMPALLDLNAEAVETGSTLVTGAGFGVVATEAVVASLCAGKTVPVHVRIDALSSVAFEAGALGEALASNIIEIITAGGRRYRDGRLVASRLGSDVQRLVLPDGTTVTSSAVPFGELVAARVVSGAPSVVVTSSLVPTGLLVRAALPVLRRILSVNALRRFAVRRMASMEGKAMPRPRAHSWGHAVVEWSGGVQSEGWLRADDGMDYTVGVVSAVVRRMLIGTAPAGSFTPTSAFGPDIAVEGGGVFLFGDVDSAHAH